MQIYPRLLVFFFTLTVSFQTNAAQVLDLKNHPTKVLQSFITGTHATLRNNIKLKEISRYTDVNQVTHIRVQEYFRDYPVWHANAVMHVPGAQHLSFDAALATYTHQASTNGTLYQRLEDDLKQTPDMEFIKRQADLAPPYVLKEYRRQRRDGQYLQVSEPKVDLQIFIDKKTKAHWAFKVSFMATGKDSYLPAKPVYFIDAKDFTIYQHWDDIQTAAAEEVRGGGLGGNVTTGVINYDDSQDHLAAFNIKRIDTICYLENKEIVVKHAESKKVMSFACPKLDPNHNNLYWSANFDQANGGYSPANDAMFAATVLKRFYVDWYKVPVLVNPDGSPMVLEMDVHVRKMDNAYWDGKKMTFGDGNELHPLTSLGLAAHEVSHGFTQQHSNLTYEGQSGALNESYSDMASQTAEFYAYHKNSWQIGKEIFKVDGETLRYIDHPSKDCFGKVPGTFCSIENAAQYYEGLDVHYSSGVYNRAFYLLSTTPGWDTRKAFAVMLQANASYWLPQTNFVDAAACLTQAAEDLQYDKKAVEVALKGVGLTISTACTNKP